MRVHKLPKHWKYTHKPVADKSTMPYYAISATDTDAAVTTAAAAAVDAQIKIK